jgi:hypothetical protein
MILMEVPDRWSDIMLAPADAPAPRYPIYLDVSQSRDGRTPLASVYLRRYQALLAQINQGPASERTEKLQALTDNQGAECLYLIITLATADGEARSLFGESTIGDTDGDGALEFLDGWDRPINFLRWAPGFDSEIQINAYDFDPSAPTNAAWLSAADNDHDPFDLFRVERAAFRLVPLIFSGGRDETFGVRLVKPHVAWTGNVNAMVPFSLSGAPTLTPYVAVLDDEDNKTEYLGRDNGQRASTDNIHNHLLGLR